MIDPIRISPHRCVNLAKLDLATRVIGYSVLKVILEIAIVEEYVWIVEPTIEMPFDRLDRLYDTIQLLVPSKDHKCSICSLSFGSFFRILTSRNKYFVMFLAYFPVDRSVLAYATRK